MTLQEYVNTMAFGIVNGLAGQDPKKMEEAYNQEFFFLPTVYCKDGFHISIQCSYMHYCVSENGIRKFGLDYKAVEWGYPSQPIDGEKYGAEDPDDTTNTVGGWVLVSDLEELIAEHGGIDLQTTLNNYLN